MSGSVVVKDVSGLEQFAGRLEKARRELEQTAKELNGALNAVSQVWQDPQRTKCEQEIQALVRAMGTFAQSASQQVSYCKRLAAHLRSAP